MNGGSMSQLSSFCNFLLSKAVHQQHMCVVSCRLPDFAICPAGEAQKYNKIQASLVYGSKEVQFNCRQKTSGAVVQAEYHAPHNHTLKYLKYIKYTSTQPTYYSQR